LKSIAFFNNKGGVGKTTLTCNIASYFALKEDAKVLVVDCDPQCNSTRLILDPDICDELYWPSGEGTPPDYTTLSSLVTPLEEGDIRLDLEASKLVPAAENRFGVDLLPGHPRMSIVEDLLGKWWSETIAGDLGAIRRTNWVTMLLKGYTDYDLVFFDLGPSLGSLNRSVLLAIDYFVAPIGADTFSLVALRNIEDWLSQWTETYAQGISLCERNFPGRVANHPIVEQPRLLKGFLGYTVQQYIAVSIRGERRATVAYERILGRVPDQVASTLGHYKVPGASEESLRLGDVPNLYSLIPLAQDSNAPIAELKSRDGLTGGQFAQQRRYVELVNTVGRSLGEKLGIGAQS
jgi:cellulose biosynthesis protein BcsQ